MENPYQEKSDLISFLKEKALEIRYEKKSSDFVKN